jgi:hypothetical protein
MDLLVPLVDSSIDGFREPARSPATRRPIVTTRRRKH